MLVFSPHPPKAFPLCMIFNHWDGIHPENNGPVICILPSSLHQKSHRKTALKKLNSALIHLASNINYNWCIHVVNSKWPGVWVLTTSDISTSPLTGLMNWGGGMHPQTEKLKSIFSFALTAKWPTRDAEETAGPASEVWPLPSSTHNSAQTLLLLTHTLRSKLWTKALSDTKRKFWTLKTNGRISWERPADTWGWQKRSVYVITAGQPRRDKAPNPTLPAEPWKEGEQGNISTSSSINANQVNLPGISLQFEATRCHLGQDK